MLKNYFKIALRNLLKNTVFSLVNIAGLAIGMAACFFIFLYIHFELSYDGWHKNIANLYRVPIQMTGSLFNSTNIEATNHPAVGPTMKKDFPEVVNYARVVPSTLFMSNTMMSYTNGNQTTTFNEDHAYIVDSSFLTMFSFPFIEGDARTALSDGQSIVISDKLAKKYFGNDDPLGKTLSLNLKTSFKVTGVFRDIPENSHLKFDLLFSFRMLNNNGLTGNMSLDGVWIWPEFYTYVQLAPGTDSRKVEEKFPAFIEKYLGTEMRKLKYNAQFHLQPVRDIHLRSNMEKEVEANGSEKEIGFLSMIGIFILVIAWINYINLSTAKSAERAKEVGIRKVAGAAKIQLIVQFMIESAMINFLALWVATALVWILYPHFGAFIGKNITSTGENSDWFQQPRFWLGLTGLLVGGALLVGAYPAFVLSSFRPILVLKGRFFQSAKGILLRKTLVSFQFVLSILLIAGAITVYSQLSYMQQQALGYNKDQVLVLKAPAVFDSTLSTKMQSFKNQLLTNPSVMSLGASTEIPGRLIVARNSVRKISEDQTHNFTPFYVSIDPDFIHTYHMQLVAGRGLLPADMTTLTDSATTKLIVNEEVVKGMGFKSNEAAINQSIQFGYMTGELRGEIVGVVKNYHQRSLRDVYDPILFYYPKFANWRYISIHLNPADVNLNQAIASFEKTYNAVFTGNAFEYFFLDDYFNRQYQADQRFGNIFSLFTGLAIFVACLGLLGLSSFVIKMRTKEIGVRKILGASIPSLLLLFSRDFIKLVGLASLIALPVIYFAAGQWLSNYAFHIGLSWWIFALPPLLLLFISLATICLQSLKAALSSPTKNLRTE
jgi:putative ABC transport system permease protein